jgi:hypothetical protein
MRGAAKLPMVLGALVVVAVIVVGVGESRRRAKLSEEAQAGGQASSQTPGNAGGAAQAPAPVPVETSMDLLPSMVGRGKDVYKGPASIQLNVNSQQRIAFGLVSLDETSNFGRSKEVQAALEHLPCGSGGLGEVSISCEIPAGKTYVLTVADVREELRSADGGYVAVRRAKKGETTEGTQYNNEVKISTTYTAITAPNGK